MQLTIGGSTPVLFTFTPIQLHLRTECSAGLPGRCRARRSDSSGFRALPLFAEPRARNSTSFNPATPTLNPKPQTLNPKPQTLNPKPQTLNPKPYAHAGVLDVRLENTTIPGILAADASSSADFVVSVPSDVEALGGGCRLILGFRV